MGIFRRRMGTNPSRRQVPPSEVFVHIDENAGFQQKGLNSERGEIVTRRQSGNHRGNMASKTKNHELGTFDRLCQTGSEDGMMEMRKMSWVSLHMLTAMFGCDACFDEFDSDSDLDSIALREVPSEISFKQMLSWEQSHVLVTEVENPLLLVDTGKDNTNDDDNTSIAGSIIKRLRRRTKKKETPVSTTTMKVYVEPPGIQTDVISVDLSALTGQDGVPSDR